MDVDVRDLGSKADLKKVLKRLNRAKVKQLVIREGAKNVIKLIDEIEDDLSDLPLNSNEMIRVEFVQPEQPQPRENTSRSAKTEAKQLIKITATAMAKEENKGTANQVAKKKAKTQCQGSGHKKSVVGKAKTVTMPGEGRRLMDNHVIIEGRGGEATTVDADLYSQIVDNCRSSGNEALAEFATEVFEDRKSTYQVALEETMQERDVEVHEYCFLNGLYSLEKGALEGDVLGGRKCSLREHYVVELKPINPELFTKRNLKYQVLIATCPTNFEIIRQFVNVYLSRNQDVTGYQLAAVLKKTMTRDIMWSAIFHANLSEGFVSSNGDGKMMKGTIRDFYETAYPNEDWSLIAVPQDQRERKLSAKAKENARQAGMGMDEEILE